MQRYWPVILLAAAAVIFLIAGVLILAAQNGDEPAAAAVTVATATSIAPQTAAPPDDQPAAPTLPPPVAPTAVASPTPEASATPDPTATPVPSPTPLWPETINGVPVADIDGMNPAVAETVRAIFSRGQQLGRDPRVFSKLGDSTILNPHFLGPFDEGEYNLGEFANLQPTIEQYPGSFARHGVAARFGMHSWTVFDPQWADKDWCLPNEDSLACEFRLNNPSVLFVRLGSNDAGAPSGFRYNLRQVIETAIDNGIIPIIGTKADRFEGSNENNDILRELAAEYNVPLWDFDLLADTIPGRGLDTDNVHLKIDDLPHDFTLPETFQRGHPLQDLSALIALDQVRRLVIP
jgi:hypothetical protein